MFQQYLLKKVFSKLEKGPLNIVSSQCVRLRHKSSKCDKCIKACPKNAIEINAEISINYDACNGCGACYEVCATGVFSLSSLSENKQLTRREFFSYAKNKITNNSLEVFDGLLNRQEEIQLPKIIPKKRIRFFEKQRKTTLEDLGNKYLPFANLGINGKCDGCDLCAIFCPTGALSKKETKKNKKITFNMAYCTKCDLCITACPNAAISYSDSINISSIINKRERLLIKHELSECGDCGTKFVSGSLCPGCEKDKADDLFFKQ